jgi:NRAMP (natural resistance-associated macrophage protein)-like metal ion transporter
VAPPRAGAREIALAREPSRLKRFFKVLGPGLIAGASDDDPATIGTCASAGASLGFATLWTMPAGVPLMAAVQFASAKVGLVTGRGLAGVLRRCYPRWLLYPVVAGLLIANTLNAGADLGAVAAGINLLVPAVPIAAVILPVAAGILALQFWGDYRLIERTFKWLTLALLAYIGAGLVTRPDVAEVLWYTFVPRVRWDRTYLEALVAIAGTTFSPYLYFWQSSQELEEKIALGRRKYWQRRGTTDTEVTYAAWHVNIGMVVSNLVTYFIILATGATLFREGGAGIQTAAEAAQALRPVAGDAAGILLVVSLIGAGMLAVPVLTTSAAYALSEAFGWKYGLDRNPARAAILLHHRPVHAGGDGDQLPGHQPGDRAVLDFGAVRLPGAAAARGPDAGFEQPRHHGPLDERCRRRGARLDRGCGHVCRRSGAGADVGLAVAGLRGFPIRR